MMTELEVAEGAYRQYILTGDGCYIDNLTPDEMRALIRSLANRGARRLGEREGTRRLVAEVWRLVENHVIDPRSPAGDAALDMRDVIDPNWWPVAEEERAACTAHEL